MENMNTREDWLSYAISNAYNLDWEKDIPKQYIDEEFVCAVVQAHGPAIKRIPEKYLTQKAVEIYARKVAADREFLMQLDKKFDNINTWAAYISSFTDRFYRIPERFRDKDIFDFAVRYYKCDVHDIPEKYQTQEMWNTYAKVCLRTDIGLIPQKFYSRELLKTIANKGYINLIPKEFQTQGMWNEFIRENPRKINEVPEEFQTREMWNKYSSIARIDKIPRKYRKITAEDPFLDALDKNFLKKEKEYLEKIKLDCNAIIDVPEFLQSYDMWQIYFKNKPQDIKYIPEEFQTQEMWNEFVKIRPARINDVPKKFQTQDIWNYGVAEGVVRAEDVPGEFQTQEMWNNYKGDVSNIPDQFRNESIWAKIIKKDPSQFRSMPICKMTTEIVENVFNVSKDIFLKCFNKIPKDVLTQSMCETYLKAYGYGSFEINKIPKKFQTQEMWNKAAVNWRFTEEDLKEVPPEFVEGVKKLILKNNEKIDNKQGPETIDNVEKVDENQIEEPRVEIVEEPRVEIVEEPKVEIIEEPKVEIKEEVKVEKEAEILNNKQQNAPKERAETLRQKFNINSEDEFDKLLVHYAQANKSYYSNEGKKHTEEEIKKRRNINSQFKRILRKKAKQMPQNENGEDFESTINSIEKGDVFSYAELKQVAENKNATMKLFNIMASGVYEKDGKKIRLTQKQRIALASTLEIVSGMRLDMNNSKKQNKEASANDKGGLASVYGEG